MSFPCSSDIYIANSSFVDVNRDVNIYTGDIVSSSRETFPWPFSRLVATSASYDADERRPPPRCHPGTRKEIIDSIAKWVRTGEIPAVQTDGESTGSEDEADENSDGGVEEQKDNKTTVCWLHGPAGAGKSAISQTLSEMFADRSLLAASFFFSRSTASVERSSMKYLFPTIAAQIAISFPDKRQKLEQLLDRDPHLANRDGGAIRLLVGMFNSDEPSESPATSLPLVVIDGLDECRDNDDQRLILTLVHDLVIKHRLPLRFLIVSRPEPHIKHMFKGTRMMPKVSCSFSLYGLSKAHDDVLTFLKSEFARIRNSEKHADVMKSVPGPWPSDDVLHQLTTNSGGYFIYVMTVIKYVDQEYFSCLDRLDEVLGISDSDSLPFAELDKLYLHVLATCPNPRLLKRILGFVIFPEPLYSCCAIGDLETMLRLRPGQIALVLRGLHSIISVDKGSSGDFTIGFIHASFRDFLLDPSRQHSYHLDRHQWEEDNIRDILHAESTLQERDGAHPRITFTWGRSLDHRIWRLYLDIAERALTFQENMDYVFRWFENHPDPIKLIEVICRSLEGDPWRSLILAQWGYISDQRRYAALHLLTGLAELLRKPHINDQGVVRPDDVVTQLNALCDLFFDAHLAMLGLTDSPATIQSLQDMYTLELQVMSLPLLDRRADDGQRLLGLSDTFLTAYQGFHRFMESIDLIGSCKRNFDDFMNDPARSGRFYCDSQVRNARLATICMRSLLASSGRANVKFYEIDNWLHHVIHAEPGNPELLSYLGRLETMGPNTSYRKSISFHDALTVVDWLENVDDLSEQLLLTWETRTLELAKPRRIRILRGKEPQMLEVFERLQQKHAARNMQLWNE